MSLLTAISVDAVRARGSITGTDVIALRQAFFEGGNASRSDVETLIALNATCHPQDASWVDCFVEILTDHVVNQAKPEGYLTLENAEWLLLQIAPNGRVVTKSELELLVNVLDKARWSPESLVAFALDQVKWAVIENTGPLRDGKSLIPGVIDEAEVELIKRILYAFGGDDNVSISRIEADILFEIDAATAGRNNAESWPDLFVKAIANCLMTASGYASPSREQALSRETWLERRASGSSDNVDRNTGGVLSAYRQQSPMERAIAALERQKIEIVTSEHVSVADASWLTARIGRNGTATPNELALMSFILSHNATIAPELEALVSRLHLAAA